VRLGGGSDEEKQINGPVLYTSQQRSKGRNWPIITVSLHFLLTFAADPTEVSFYNHGK
jgi:hypothetical protein